MRLLCAAALSLSLGLWLAFAQDKKPTESKADRVARLAVLKDRYDATYKELAERFAKATPADKQGIRTEIREEAVLIIGKVLAVAEGDPKDETGFDAATFILRTAASTGAGGPDVEKAIGIVAEHHVGNAKIKDALIPAMGLGAAGEKLLKVVGEKTTDKEVKGLALFLRGHAKAEGIAEEEDEAKVTLSMKEATGLLEEAAKVAPETQVGNSKQTIAKLVANDLEVLKQTAVLEMPAPEVESRLLDGKKVKLSDYKGKVVLLDVWATWCLPCRLMIPHEREMVEKNKDKPFVLVSVSVDVEKKTLEKFLDEEKMPWVHWWDNGPETSAMKKYRVRGFPTLYLIDHSGVIRHKWVGNPGNEKLDAAVEELVKAATKAKG